VLARLGLAAFGLWAVRGAVINYVALADLGIRRSLSRFVALCESNGDERALQECPLDRTHGRTRYGRARRGHGGDRGPLMHDSFGRLCVGDMCILLSCAAVMLMCELVAWALMAIPVGFRRMLSASVAHLIGTVLNFSFTLAVLLLDRTSVAGRVGGRLVAFGPGASGTGSPPAPHRTVQ
jgi:hypothetical protein